MVSNCYESPSFQAEQSIQELTLNWTRNPFIDHLCEKFLHVNQMIRITPTLPSQTWCIENSKQTVPLAGKARKPGFQKVLTQAFHISLLSVDFPKLFPSRGPHLLWPATYSHETNGNSLFLKLLSFHQMTLKLTESQVNWEGEEKDIVADAAQSHNFQLVFSGVLGNQMKSYKHSPYLTKPRAWSNIIHSIHWVCLRSLSFKKVSWSQSHPANSKQLSPHNYIHSSLAFLCLSDQPQNIISHSHTTGWASPAGFVQHQ